MEPTHTPGDFKMQDGDWIFVSRIDDAEKISSNDEGKPKKVCISLVMDRYEVSMTVKISVVVDQLMLEFLKQAADCGCFKSGNVEPCSFMYHGIQLGGEHTLEHYGIVQDCEIEVILDEEMDFEGDNSDGSNFAPSDSEDEGTKVTLGIEWRDPKAGKKTMNEDTFHVKTNSKLMSDLPALAVQLKLREKFVLYCGDKLIGVDDTPHSLGLEYGDMLTVVRLSGQKETKEPGRNRKQLTPKKRQNIRVSRPRQKKPARLAGDRPIEVRQQMDADVRAKLKQTQQGMQTAHKMSIPFTRSNGYRPPLDPLDASEQAVKEEEFPWVVHTTATFTEQVPNGNGQNKEGTIWLDQPEMHFWVGSKQAGAKMEDVFKEITKVKMVFHDKYENYLAALTSKKEAPKRKRKTRAELTAAKDAEEERKLKAARIKDEDDSEYSEYDSDGGDDFDENNCI
jgi:hypothetical protein